MIWLTALSALLVWWWFRPAPVEEKLAGGWRIRVPQRIQVDAKTGEEQTIAHGPFVVLDDQGYVRCRGKYRDGQASEYWTYYHANGRKSLAGYCRNGGRTGCWTQWNEQGRKVAETEYGPPLLVASTELTAAANGWPTVQMEEKQKPECFHRRQGAARRWWENGQLRSAGQFDQDRRSGPWQFWNRDGQLVAEGSFQRGQRHGVWKIAASAGPLRRVHYLDGEKGLPLEQRLPLLGQQLASENWSFAKKAARQLALSGPEGFARLKLALRDSRQSTTIHALRELKSLGLCDDDVLAAVSQMSRSSDTSLRIRAASALYAFQQDQRRIWGERLLKLAVADAESGSLVVQEFATQPQVDLLQLEQALSHEELPIRQVSCEILAELQYQTPEHLPREKRQEAAQRRLAIDAIAERAEKNPYPDVVESPFRWRRAGGNAFGGCVF